MTDIPIEAVRWMMSEVVAVPINRGVELDSDVADSEHSVILNQVLNGVAVRMAVLVLLAEADKNRGNVN